MIKKITIFLSFLFIVMLSFAQTSTMSAITPPSPEAISLTKTDFSEVNLYTGKVNYTLPIYVIKSGNLSFPVSLNYSGGNGIKVSEVASSVGLGWNITSTGLVTRTIKGQPDDHYEGSYMGYIHMGEFPAINQENKSVYEYYYLSGKYDTQPDLYNLSVSGVSVSFYLNRQKKPVYIEKTDVVIRPIFTGYTINSFEAVNTDGTTYYFQELEDNRTEVSGVVTEDNDYHTTSWYLTKVVSPEGIELAHFNYAAKESYYSVQQLTIPFSYNAESTDIPFMENLASHSLMYVRKPILQNITFPTGQVIFKMSVAERFDLDGDRYLDSVIVKNINNKVIKMFHFNYSYFSPAATLADGANHSYGEVYLRLRLDSLQEISSIGRKQVYCFEYNMDTNLPERVSQGYFINSFPLDHWGYFNGQISNTTSEGKHREKYYFQQLETGSIDTLIGEFGSANREPNVYYSSAGILQKVKLPTGGYIKYNYEQHSSNDVRLPNKITTANIVYSLDEQPNYFTVAMIREPFGRTTVSAVTSSEFNIVVSIYLTTQPTTPFRTDTLSGAHNRAVFNLKNGSYFLKAKLNGYHPDSSYNYGTMLKVEQETELANKPVGGVRIKSTELYDPITGSSHTRKYFYNIEGIVNSTSASTGTIANVPHYGRQLILHSWTGGAYAQGYLRQLESSYPLNVTQGSHVGYGKVWTVDNDTLRTEYNFTSFKEFLETSDGYENTSLVDAVKVIGGVKYEVDPVAPYDERDFLRGRLISTIHYKKTSGGFEKNWKQENEYIFTMGMPLRLANGNFRYVPSGSTESIEGLGMIRYGGLGDVFWLKKYKLHTGRYDLKKTIETFYKGTDSLNTQTEYEYGDSPLYSDSVFHYQPTKIIRTDSDGAIITNIMYYPYNWRLGLSEWSSADIDTLKLLDNANRIGIPLIKRTERDGVLIAKVRNDYGFFTHSVGNLLGLKKIKIWNANTLEYEERIRVNRYDINGNILEQQVGELPTSYLYSYKGQHPIAEVRNATFASIEMDLGASTIANFSNAIPSGKTAIDSFLWSLGARQWSSYVYEPLIGLTSHTDVKGMTTYYGYDDFNQLQNIKDQNENIIKSYKYHYLNDASDAPIFYNVAMSQNFTKNDCAIGTGTAVIYAIAAGTYTASSQSAANTLATLALLADGQAYANASGGCAVTSVSVNYMNKTKTSGGVFSGDILALYIKNSSGTIVYSFNYTQLLTGISITPGIYTLEFVVSGSAYDSSTQLGWGMVTVAAPSGFYWFNRNDVSGGNYSLYEVNLNGTSTIKLERMGIE